MTHFAAALAFTLKKEGLFVNDPDDPGGATNYGITQATLAQWRGEPVSVQDVVSLTQEQAGMIYRERYWKPLACDKLFVSAIACALFDAGVLFGVHAAAVCIQRAAACQRLGLVADGFIGPATVKALNEIHPVVLLGSFKWILRQRIDEIIEKRPKSAKFRKGWVARVDAYTELAS